jgi:VIT1/CCC1 family predicted Fe2+/Mn2+ transporter
MGATQAVERRPVHDRAWLREHLAVERRQTELLGELREVLFGVQDGLTSTVVIVTAVGAATNDRFPVLVAGVSAMLAGMFAMAVGEYTGSKAVHEIERNEIAGEREEVRERPDEAIAEVALMFEEDGLSAERAMHVAAEIATSPDALLKTMVEKEHGIAAEIGAPPLQGAVIMGIAFGIGSLPALLPYVVLPVNAALIPSLGLSAVSMFALGVLKSRWTKKNWLKSGAEVLLLTVLAGVAGYLFGALMPSIAGVAPVG